MTLGNGAMMTILLEWTQERKDCASELTTWDAEGLAVQTFGSAGLKIFTAIPGTSESRLNMMDASGNKVGVCYPRAGFRGKLSREERLKSLGQLITAMINKGNVIKTASKYWIAWKQTPLAPVCPFSRRYWNGRVPHLKLTEATRVFRNKPSA